MVRFLFAVALTCLLTVTLTFARARATRENDTFQKLSPAELEFTVDVRVDNQGHAALAELDAPSLQLWAHYTTNRTQPRLAVVLAELRLGGVRPSGCILRAASSSRATTTAAM